MLKNYFKIAWRNLTKNKVSTTINITGLAIGISACVIIYLITHFELSYESFHPNKNRIYRAVTDIRENKGAISHAPLISYSSSLLIRNQFTGIDKTAYFFSYYFKISIPDGKQNAKIFAMPDPSKDGSDVIITEPQFFEIFKYKWLAGNAATALNSPFKVVLTESKARNYFGLIPLDEIMGKEVIYNDSLRVTVSGIVKDFQKNTNIIFNDFISFPTIQSSFLSRSPYLPGAADPEQWGWSDYGQAFIELSKGISAAQVDAQAASLFKRLNNLGGGLRIKGTFHLQPLEDIHFNPDYGADAYSRQSDLSTLYGLMGIAAFILILAVANFINLSTAQSIQRAKEIGIRKVLGSNRSNLIMQFLSETFLLVALAVVLSLVFVRLALGAFHQLIPEGVFLNFLSPSLFIFLVSIIIITTLLAGFYPAKVLSSYLPALSLKGHAVQPANHRISLRKALIVFQFTVSLVFIIGTIVIGDQIHYILNKNLGFQKDAIVNIPTDAHYGINKKYVLAREIKNLSGVEIVSVSQDFPEVNYSRGGLLVRKDNGAQVQSQYRAGDEQFIPLYGLKIIAGRNVYAPGANDSITEFLINETSSQQLGFKKPDDALGHIVQTGFFNKTQFVSWNTGPIVGVLADFHSQPLNSSIAPTCFLASKNLYYGAISIKLSTQGRQLGNFNASLTNIEKQWKKIFPEEAFNYSFYDQTIARFYDKEQKVSQIMNSAMLIAVFISCMGLFGLVAFVAERRTREIGIRKVLGATVSGIVLLLSKDFLYLVLISILIASPIAWYFLHQWLEDYAYRININWWVFVLAGFSAILITLITVSFQTIKAALANPVKSLKVE
jgi:putative ABC transport system permease protein